MLMVKESMTKEARIYNGKKINTTSSTSGVGKAGQLCKSMKLEHSLTLCARIN